MLCHSAVRKMFVSRGDVLFVQCEVREEPEMYFVTKGELEYGQMRDGYVAETIKEGDWVAEPILWCSWVHCGVLHARCESELLSLSAKSFCALHEGVHSQSLGKYAAG